ncbi:hypothetical protein SAMN02745975_02518 [Geosporobacter subterraneus DSM 17957]|uniref:Uncharacterized protein n=1 Tax=Geosporobacter subterraneus DSM 17957 TaxID=1121919 RepID=A0A1M6KVX2_9FIRM|nr:hypothetical protein SAMN02745975_02518 [Geosporobacter subterraneus DSM 17957]
MRIIAIHNTENKFELIAENLKISIKNLFRLQEYSHICKK